MNMTKNKMYYVFRLMLVVATQISWVLLLLAFSIHLFDVTISSMLVFTVFLCSLLPLLYGNVQEEITVLKHAWHKL